MDPLLILIDLGHDNSISSANVNALLGQFLLLPFLDDFLHFCLLFGRPQLIHLFLRPFFNEMQLLRIIITIFLGFVFTKAVSSLAIIGSRSSTISKSGNFLIPWTSCSHIITISI
jgi:hypothetical protein